MNIEQQSHFAAYYNMARRNMFVTLNHIAKLVGLPAEKDNIKESKMEELEVVKNLTQGTAEQKERIKSLLDKHMPFIRPIVESERKYQKALVSSHKMYYEIITRWCKVLCYYRDKYTHLYFNDIRTNDSGENGYLETEKNVARDLNILFTASATCIKNRFSLTTELEFLTKNRYLVKNVPKLDDKGEKQYDDKKKLITEKKAEINTSFFYSLQNDKGCFSEMGVIFFLCQFIEKKYATMLFDQQGYKGYGIYENHNETRRRYIREVFSAYRLDMPRNRMDAERNELALAMDMLNELRRCPRELFDIISPDNQAKFRITSDVTGEEILLRRSSDRFPTLALQYIDYTGAFNDIRFQVSLGKYRYKFYHKTCVDGKTYVRSLQKELNGFGRINEIDKAREERWSEYIRKFDDVECDTADTAPYITDHHAQYVFHANRVGLYFNDAIHHDMRDGMYLPIIKNDKAPCVQPRCWLSLYDLPALMFHYLLTKEKVEKNHACATEMIIKRVVNNYRQFFLAIADGSLRPSGNAKDDFAHIKEKYDINRTDIPRDLQDYFTGKKRTEYDKLMRKKLICMIEENDEQLELHHKRREKVLDPEMRYGKRNYTSIKPGHIASLLAHDIVLFMPDARYKPTGKNFSVMQAALATFNEATNKGAWSVLEDIMVEAGVIGWDDVADNHPFLDALFDIEIKDVVELYERYWSCRGRYLRTLLSNNQYDKIPGYKQQSVRDEQFYRQRAAIYMEQPMELPRGLFDNAIKEICAERIDFKKETCNVTYLISCYMQKIHSDDSQQFYSYPRHYSCLGVDTHDVNTKRRIERYLTIQERSTISWDDAYERFIPNEDTLRKEYDKKKGEKLSFNEYKNLRYERAKKAFEYAYNKMTDTERILRRYRVQDMLMYLAACDIIGSVANVDFGYRLYMIAGNEDKQFFDFTIPHFEVPITLTDGRVCKLTQDGIKLKNYGDFFRFIYDIRVRTLLDNTSRQEIERSLLEAELDAYDGCRPEVFRILLTIENRIVNAHPELKGKRIDFKKVLEVMTDCSDEDKEIMRLIRNGFSHNYYPIINNADYNNIPHVAESLKDMLPNI